MRVAKTTNLMTKREIKDTRTADQVSQVGTIVYDVFDEGARFIVMRGPFHWCGYIGIPQDHPLAGLSYDDLSFVSAHGGLTYASQGGEHWPKGYYWYGWDYGHAGDVSHYEGGQIGRGEKDWTVQEVIEDSWETLWDFKQLLKLAEKIKND